MKNKYSWQIVCNYLIERSGRVTRLVSSTKTILREVTPGSKGASVLERGQVKHDAEIFGLDLSVLLGDDHG